MTTRNILDIPAKLSELNDIFVSHGFELWFVGGCVRDALMGVSPKDIDLTTSATPEEQIAIYREYDLRYIETGLQHGTVTVVLDGEPYEITTYRIDRETNGRHATVEFTRSLHDDLFRRDLTINAIAMGFNGEIFDPFGGANDAEQGIIRFVGNAADRIREDYLRILRFFRFFGRISQGDINAEAQNAIKSNRVGLKQISVERVWAEMAKIVAGPNPDRVLEKMFDTGVLAEIGMIDLRIDAMMVAHKVTRDPVILMTILLEKEVQNIYKAWKWSNEEKDRAVFVVRRAFDPYTVDMAKRDLFEGALLDIVETVLRIQGQDADKLSDWNIPVFPVTGEDMIKKGIRPGPEMGQLLRSMREEWIASDYSVDKVTLMSVLE